VYQKLAGLPPATVDHDMLRQALLAALSFALESGGHGLVEIRGASDDASVLLTLRIEGAAQPLQAAHDDRRIEAARRLLERQGGALRLVPRDDGSLAALSVAMPRARPTTVLLVDDDPDFVQLLQRYLRGHPYAVLQANNASRAIGLAREARPDFVLLDVMMPSQDGWDLLGQLRQLDETRDVPVVICSVLGDTALAEALGATAVLPKPVTQRSLLALLQRHARPSTGRPVSR
jgi:CheY-like chemotaxis protein